MLMGSYLFSPLLLVVFQENTREIYVSSSLCLTYLCSIHVHTLFTPIEYKQLEGRYHNLFCLLSLMRSCIYMLSTNTYCFEELKNYLKFYPKAHKIYFLSRHLNNFFLRIKHLNKNLLSPIPGTV